MSLGELETFITEQEKLASAANPEQEESPESGEVLDVRLREKHIHGTMERSSSIRIVYPCQTNFPLYWN